jgi:invasion protein IalB
MRAGRACVLWSLLLSGVTACDQVGTKVLSQPDTLSAVAPSITEQPADQSIKVGDAATFSVVAAGSEPLSYQWHKNGAAIAGATAPLYTTPAAIPDNDGDAFAVIISNPAGTTASSSAKLSVTASAIAPAITSEPSDASITAGQTTTFSVVASGTAPLLYQWEKNGTVIGGATSASYTTPAEITADSGATFAVVVSNSAGSATSRSAKLNVAVPGGPLAPTITVQPADQSINTGQTATYSVTATGTAPLSYQWQKNGTAIAGATAASYTTPAETPADSGATFAVVVSNSAGSVASRAAHLAVAAAPTITTQPADQSIRAGQTATFSVVASGTAPLSYQWQKNGTAIAGATAASYTTPAETPADNGATFAVVVSNSTGNATSRSARLTVSPAVTSGTDVVTYKSDLARTGQNLTETVLTLSNVNATSFGKLRFLSVDGNVDAQPLYLSALTVQGATHNVVFVATENDSVYAFDVDSGAVLWHVSLLGVGESPSGTHGCGQVEPVIGITSTPVIDRAAGSHGTIYVVAMSNSGADHQRLHALDLTTGAELPGGPREITATYLAPGGATRTFDPGQYAERAALLLSNGVIYTSWTSHCDVAPYTGWIIAYSQTSLAQTAVLNIAPNGTGNGPATAGPAIWMSGGGPAADAAGNIYLLAGNGAFETTLDANGFPSGGDYGNSFLKLASVGGHLAVADYFTMFDEVSESGADLDLGSGGVMLLPDLTDAAGTVRHLAVGAGKDRNLYVVNRDSMGKFSPNSNNIWQQLSGVLGAGIWSTPAWFNGSVYYGPNGAALKAFTVVNARLSSSPVSQTAATFVYPGTAPAVSANGSSNGIVWAHENTSPAVLHAYDASNLAHELYNSSQAAGGRDRFGAGNKFITPTIADGKVFVGTTNGVAVFGLLP